MRTQHNPVALAAGQEYEASNGEHITIIEDDRRGDKPLVIRYDDRTQLDADLNEVTATAVMSRYSFSDMATFDGFTLVADNTAEPEPADTMPGEFVGPAPRCPRCSKFMSRFYDGEGMPVAMCGGQDCDCAIDASELIDDGHFEHAGAR